MSIEKYFEQVDKQQDDYIQRLREIVAIPSISSDPSYRNNVVRMGEWLINELEKLGASVKRVEPGTQVIEGQTIDLPPVILGTYGTDPAKKTLLVYGHYDVQPALKEDGWATDPWQLTEDNQGRMFGRGSTDDKGPVLGWLCAVQAYKDLGIDLPVNLKFCFEGMEEDGSVGLEEVITQEANAYFKDVDAVCISDNYWLGKKKPCLTYGLRGVSYFKLTISGPGQDLHSGVFGGTVHEPMTDLVSILSKLVSPDGKVLVPGIMDDVAGLDEDEKATYENLEFTMVDFTGATGSECNIHSDARDTLMHRWRYPSLSIHGIEGAFHAPGAKTVIPAQVHGKFSIRTVPNQDPDRITEIVRNYVEAEFNKLGSRNQLKIECLHAGKWWISSPKHPNFVAGSRAIERVFKVKPDLTREGGSIPITITFQDALKKNVLLLPMGACDDGAHSINEKLDRHNFIEGIKLFGAYLHELTNVEL